MIKLFNNRFVLLAVFILAGGWIPAADAQEHYYTVQVGAYRSPANADQAVSRLKARGIDAFSRQESAGSQGMFFRV
ncbi:MAG: SPOR domain-containing protein, partial [Deltaproteobacteria bacterium]|nr:SPOR domain-containing protein [Deltaproteobacteria bacterium]